MRSRLDRHNSGSLHSAAVFAAAAALIITMLMQSAAQCQAAKPDPVALAKQYSDSASANAAMMLKYAWKMRVEITVDGKVSPAQLYQMRYDSTGKLQKTALTQAPDSGGRGVRGKIKKNKMEEFMAWAGQVAELVKQYAAPTPGTMLDFYAKATYTLQPDGKIKVSGDNMMQKGDHADFWVDLATGIPLVYAFTTNLGKDVVSTTIAFDQIPGGPRYPETVTVVVPTKKVTARVETFEYVLQKPAAAPPAAAPK